MARREIECILIMMPGVGVQDGYVVVSLLDAEMIPLDQVKYPWGEHPDIAGAAALVAGVVCRQLRARLDSRVPGR